MAELLQIAVSNHSDEAKRLLATLPTLKEKATYFSPTINEPLSNREWKCCIIWQRDVQSGDR